MPARTQLPPPNLLLLRPRHEPIVQVVVAGGRGLAHGVQRDVVVRNDQPVLADERAGPASSGWPHRDERVGDARSAVRHLQYVKN